MPVRGRGRRRPLPQPRADGTREGRRRGAGRASRPLRAVDDLGDSVDRAWIETNRIALYLAAFVVGCVVVRSPGHRRALAIALGPLFGLAGLVVLIRLFAGDAAAFIDHRLDAPLDYINGSAGFLLMGLWPLAAAAERSRSPIAAGLGAAGVVVLANLSC